ncbi:class I SAM-dependent methyltransferase [Cupriavidus sp. SW-Y-13]|uniref:class I SAM-dependent methyltransferase n=1 Tax=Cupriavidus sp. SW-Y-13 TaxID=2653854 RepID=UPI001366218D|nr:class I SAM-dependent methyltransferase [Cupriavidus sp. SW-Y-13]MWL90512.1 hypothetical protein [Cupriavidus sp. SW-Y-13]
MTQIDSASRLAALIRAQVASLGSRRTNASTARKESARQEAAHGTGTEPDLASVIARRVAAIDPDDPERRRKAFRVFLESVLLAEFGESLMNDARFYQLVEDVHLQMESEPEVAAAIEEASQLLVQGRPGAQSA